MSWYSQKKATRLFWGDEAAISLIARCRDAGPNPLLHVHKPTSGVGEKDVIFRFTQNPFALLFFFFFFSYLQHEEYSV